MDKSSLGPCSSPYSWMSEKANKMDCIFLLSNSTSSLFHIFFFSTVVVLLLFPLPWIKITTTNKQISSVFSAYFSRCSLNVLPLILAPYMHVHVSSSNIFFLNLPLFPFPNADSRESVLTIFVGFDVTK